MGLHLGLNVLHDVGFAVVDTCAEVLDVLTPLVCICRSFVLSCHLDRFVALSFKLALDRRFWATFERQVGPGPAVLGTFERQVGPGPAVSDETSVPGTRR